MGNQLPRAESSFQTIQIDDDSLNVDLGHLHATVLRTSGRVELTNAAGGACVLMSRAELDSLERALEILSNTQDVREMSDQLMRLASMTACHE
jgi:PHD/YefM family antitoxin component YafN of YafNO toxin-antitoxin module